MKRRPLHLVSRNILTLDGNVADTFFIDMESPVEQMRLKNVWPGHLYVVLFSQNKQGGNTVTWTGYCANAADLDTLPHARTVQCFIGSTGDVWWQAIAPGTWI